MQSFQKFVRCCIRHQNSPQQPSFIPLFCPLSIGYLKEQNLQLPQYSFSHFSCIQRISVSAPAPSYAQRGYAWLQPQPWEMLSNSSTGFSSDTTLGSYQHFTSLIYLPYNPNLMKAYLLHKHWMAQLLGFQCKISWESGRFKVKAFLVNIFNLCFINTGKGPHY